MSNKYLVYLLYTFTGTIGTKSVSMYSLYKIVHFLKLNFMLKNKKYFNSINFSYANEE